MSSFPLVLDVFFTLRNLLIWNVLHFYLNIYRNLLRGIGSSVSLRQKGSQLVLVLLFVILLLMWVQLDAQEQAKVYVWYGFSWGSKWQEIRG